MKRLVMVVIVVLMSACSSAGAGLEARLGYYREDERRQSSAARYELTKLPFLCRVGIKDCPEVQTLK